jgi:hypothetical protein
MARNLHHSCRKEKAMSLSQQQLGFHYYPDTDHYSESDLNAWLPVLKSAGANWLTMRANAAPAIPQAFINPIIENGIQPIIHVVEPVGTLRMAQVYTTLKFYAEAGATYVIFFDRPNMRSSWPSSSWSHNALVSRYVDMLLPILEAQIEMGIKPTLPPLEPGGDYWDTAFSETSLAMIQDRASAAVIQDLTLSLYMWTFGKPLDWGQGGHSAWPDARPYSSPVDSQDQRGFQINDWYQEIAERVLGRRLSALVVAGGAGPSETYPNAEAHQLGNNEVARYLAEHDLPQEILNFCFYPLATAENHKDFPTAWYMPPEAKGLPEELVEMESIKREVEIRPEKSIEHYVLLGFSNQINGLELWNAIAPPIMSARATVGFSLEEAKQATRVSIIGDYETFPVSIEDELMDSGSTIERYEEWDTDEFLLAASSWVAQTTVTGAKDD